MRSLAIFVAAVGPALQNVQALCLIALVPAARCAPLAALCSSARNLLLLFWLSLFPFATAWMGQNHSAALPSALYGGVLLMAALSYSLLQHTILVAEGPSSFLRSALGADWKGKSSPFLYGTAIAAAFYAPKIAQAIYVAVALVCLIPDRRIERALARKPRHPRGGD